MMLTYEEVEFMFDNGELDQEYCGYIEQCTNIGNGDMLILAMESGEYAEGFLDWFYGQQKELA